MKIQTVSYAIMIVLVLMIGGSEAHNPSGANSAYHREEPSTNDAGDNILSRVAGAIDTPVEAHSRTTVVQRSRRQHIPHQHEWESWASVSNSDEKYRIKDWYTVAIAKDDTKLPTSDNGFKYDGVFDYSVRAWDM
ncbi:hypothetical protein F4X73_01705, partial [Candidatus Poribacteria bacterium]|nr:hypothetical protein [Candidatus Poribacteria bacterium]